MVKQEVVEAVGTRYYDDGANDDSSRGRALSGYCQFNGRARCVRNRDRAGDVIREPPATEQGQCRMPKREKHAR